MESSKIILNRLIQDGARSGAFNMAADLYFARQASEDGRLILRLYAWDRPTLSLGFHQKIGSEQIERLQRSGIPIVRRPTGGRAVLHDRELTYCLCIPEEISVFLKHRKQLLKEIGTIFVRAAAIVDLKAEIVRAGSAGDERTSALKKGSLLCYDSLSRWEVRLGGRKWIGSAQRFLPGVLLQHGSIPLQESSVDLSLLLGTGTSASIHNGLLIAEKNHTNLESSLRNAIAQAFAEQWEINWLKKPIDPTEESEISALATEEKYGKLVIEQSAA